MLVRYLDKRIVERLLGRINRSLIVPFSNSDATIDPAAATAKIGQ